MISLSEIGRKAEAAGVSSDIIEKDYAISWLLACLARSPLRKDFVFYGGTAIKRIFFEDHRFSEDIDLVSCQRHEPGELSGMVSSCLDFAKEEANFRFESDPGRTLSDRVRTQLFVRYAGYDEVAGAPKEIRIDLAMGMDPWGDASVRPLLETYSDLKERKIALRTRSLDTIMASKIGMLMDPNRKEPRDLYDIWFLLERTKKRGLDWKRVRELFKQNYGFYPSMGVLAAHLEKGGFQGRWEMRLSRQIADLPALESVIREVRDGLAAALEKRDAESGAGSGNGI